jgi:hypothetical protein
MIESDGKPSVVALVVLVVLLLVDWRVVVS